MFCSCFSGVFPRLPPQKRAKQLREVTKGPGNLGNPHANPSKTGQRKGSPAIPGGADIFVVPDLETGNMLAKQLEYLADAQIARIILRARAPIVLTSRADKMLARVAPRTIALVLARHNPSAADALGIDGLRPS